MTKVDPDVPVGNTPKGVFCLSTRLADVAYGPSRNRPPVRYVNRPDVP